jgi:hypothetical protein
MEAGDTVGGELGAETLAGVLDAAVGVQQEPRGASAAATPDGHQKRHDDKPGFERGRKGPAEHAFAVGVDHHGQVEPAGAGGQIGDVGLPHLVASGDRPGLGESIGRDRAVVVGLGRARAKPAALAALQALLAHQPGDPRFSDLLALRSRLHGHAWVAVALARGREDRVQLWAQRLVGTGSALVPARGPRMVTAAGDLQGRA